MKELIVKIKAPINGINTLWNLQSDSVGVVRVGVVRTLKDTKAYTEWRVYTKPEELDKLAAKISKRKTVIDVRLGTHRHNWACSYSTKNVTFSCWCGAEKVAPATRRVKQHLKKIFSPGRDDNVHFVWHQFAEKFFKDHHSPTFNLCGFELMCEVSKWADKFKKDVRIISCDDSYHCGSMLVLIEHRAKNSYMGTSVVYIPQCTGEPPSIFFLYPEHAKRLISTLKTIRKAALPIEKRAQEKGKEWSNYLKTLEPPSGPR